VSLRNKRLDNGLLHHGLPGRAARREPEKDMSQLAEDRIRQHLLDAVERLQEDIAKVELWAAALSGFAQPVPKYEPRGDHLMPRRDRAQADRVVPPPARMSKTHQP
jgi:hypothetical protein